MQTLEEELLHLHEVINKQDDEIIHLQDVTNKQDAEIINFHDVINKQNTELLNLKKNLEHSKNLIQQLENVLMYQEPDISKKKRKVLSSVAKSKLDFYQKNKNNPEVIEPLKKKFRSIGVNYIPWCCIKEVTDKIYEKISNG